MLREWKNMYLHIKSKLNKSKQLLIPSYNKDLKNLIKYFWN